MVLTPTNSTPASIEDLVARLRATDPFVNDPISLKPRLRNPDGPEAVTALSSAQAEIERLREALTFLADLPDPGEETERSATFYRIHSANLKQVAAKALGRETVSQAAMNWAEDAALKARAQQEMKS